MNQVTEYVRFGYTFYVDKNCDEDRSRAERRARVKLWSQGRLFSSLVLSYISKCMPGTGDKMVSKKRMSLTSQNVWCSRKDNYNIKQFFIRNSGCLISLLLGHPAQPAGGRVGKKTPQDK